MSKTLLIIESPGKKKKLESILGSSYLVRASFGHIRDLPARDLGVSAPDYRPEYVIEDKRTKETVAALKKLAKECDNVLLATDPDREGEAIAWHVAQELKLINPQRVTYQEITEKAIKAAVKTPRPLDLALVRAQEARRVLDRLVGYEVSPALSNAAAERLSAGRVQTPAVRLVVDRERAIRAFKPTAYFGAEIHFAGTPPWRATWEAAPFLPAGEKYFTDRDLAQAVANTKQARVAACADTQSKAAPKAPFTTSTLQQRAQTALKFKPKKTMELAQSLYEQGVITYMRTDSPNLSDDACSAIADYANAQGLPLSPTRRRWKAKASAQEAHEAIRPTHIEDVSAGRNDEERALYKLIWSRAVASQLADATFAVRTATLEGLNPIDSKHPTFTARGKTLTDAGWKVIYDEEDESDEGDNADNPVPAMEAGQILDVSRGELQSKTTKAPARFTLATLVKELEDHGIGRPSTYAGILDNITSRGYIIEDKKGQLAAAPIAETIIDTLAGKFEFVELDYTRQVENDLDAIAEGKLQYANLVSHLHDGILASLSAIHLTVKYPCPNCGKALGRRRGPNGFFWGCTGYPDCKTSLPDAEGKPGVRSSAPAKQNASTTVSAHTCPKCTKPLRRNTRALADDPKGKGWDFYGCTGYPKCKETFRVGGSGEPVFP